MKNENLAKQLGVTSGTISNWKTGKTRPSKKMLERLSSEQPDLLEEIQSAFYTPMRNVFTKEFLKDLFFYDSEGWLVWKNPELVNRKKELEGSRLQTSNSAGYEQTTILSKSARLHYLIWVWHNGIPGQSLQVDHIDRNRTNNRIENLRLLSSSENLKNVEAKTASGIPGLVFKRQGHNYWWTARRTLDKKERIDLGSKKNFIQAARLIFESEQELHSAGSTGEAGKFLRSVVAKKLRFSENLIRDEDIRKYFQSLDNKQYMLLKFLEGKKAPSYLIEFCEELVENFCS